MKKKKERGNKLWILWILYFCTWGIVGFILSIVSEIIIKIDDIMTDKKIDRYFNSIGVSEVKMESSCL